MMKTTVHWAEILAKFQLNLAKFWLKSAITWAIIGEFDNFGQISAFKHNFGPIYGLESVYCDLLLYCSPSIGLKLHLKAQN